MPRECGIGASASAALNLIELVRAIRATCRTLSSSSSNSATSVGIVRAVSTERETAIPTPFRGEKKDGVALDEKEGEEPVDPAVDIAMQLDFASNNRDRAVEAFLAEPLSQRWAKKTGESLTQQLTAMGEQNGFSLNKVTCKSETCIASLQWSSVGEGQTKFGHVAEATLAENCATDVYLLPEDEGEETVVYRCGNQRVAAN